MVSLDFLGMRSRILIIFYLGKRIKMDMYSALWQIHVLQMEDVKLPQNPAARGVVQPLALPPVAPLPAGQAPAPVIDLEALADQLVGMIAPQIIAQVTAALSTQVVNAVVTALGNQQAQEDMEPQPLPPPLPIPAPAPPAPPPTPPAPAPPNPDLLYDIGDGFDPDLYVCLFLSFFFYFILLDNHFYLSKGTN